MFAGLFQMHESCRACGLRYEREPGYFLGSIYVNYGLTALLTTIGWVALRFGYGLDSGAVLLGLALFCLIFPALFFRHARALWLAIDCRFDRSLFDNQEGPNGEGHDARPD
jgi:apolipoprotein N-acyltransferase